MNQIVRMKKQAFGIEAEMNNITCKDAAKLATDLFEISRYETPHAATGTTPGATGARTDVSVGPGETLASTDTPAQSTQSTSSA